MAPDEKVVNSTKLSSSFISLWPIVPILMLPLAVAEDVIDVIGKTKGTPDCVSRSSGLSKSTGGLCLNENQINLLKTRGGNMSTGEETIGN